MTIAVFSDVHGNIAALDAILADIARRDITEVINLGDSLCGPFDPAGTADRLIELGIPTVAGNHDRMLVDRPTSEMGTWERWAIDALTPAHLDWVRALPATLVQGEVFGCHATPDKDDENWLDHRGTAARLVPRDLAEIEARAGAQRYPVMLCGHTHQPRVVRLPDGTLIVNPGSVGCPAYLDTRVAPSFIHQTGLVDAAYAIVEKRNGVWTADRISVPYDPTPMAALARSHDGAGSWVQAVTTGWFA